MEDSLIPQGFGYGGSSTGTSQAGALTSTSVTYTIILANPAVGSDATAVALSDVLPGVVQSYGLHLH